MFSHKLSGVVHTTFKALHYSLLVLGFSASVMAQPMPPVFEELKLTSQQQTQIKAILKAEREATLPLIKQLKASHEQTKQEIEALLTAEQRSKLKEIDETMGGFPPRPF